MIDKAAAPVSKRRGDEAEALALAHLQRQGLRLVERNYRVARGPSARGVEIDLILRDRDGTLVFVEVRSRSASGHGGAAASIGAAKQARLRLPGSAALPLRRWHRPGLHRMVTGAPTAPERHGGRGARMAWSPCSNSASSSSSSTVPTSSTRPPRPWRGRLPMR
jgi:putative endonuclease